LRRFFVKKIHPHADSIIITGPEARHITRVLRMSIGEELVLMDELGRRYGATIEDIRPKAVKVKINKLLPQLLPSPVRIVLAQSLIRSKNMDLVIQKSTELGVNSIIPFISNRTAVRLKKEHHSSKQRHWQEIAINASKQSDAIKPPTVEGIVDYNDMMESLKGLSATKVILWESEYRTPLKEILRSSQNRDCFVGIIGPEGGFSGNEILRAKESGFVPVTVGRRILRAETASIVMLSLVQYEWGDMN